MELPSPRLTKYQGALKYQSARSAFFALLQASKPTRVWMPYYICESMLAPVKAAKIEIRYYSINNQLGIADDITLAATDLLLYVNYFGICSGQVEKVLARFSPSQVVMDFSQAFFAAPQNCLATIYSPRKFFGLPDGGLLFTQLNISVPEAVDIGSEKRMRHLIARLGGTAESGYADYQLAELSLNEFEPKRMSLLTERIFGAIDFEAVRTQRNKNFYYLNKNLNESNSLRIDLEDVDGPMCYPYFSDNPELRDILITKRVFIPTYWPEVLRHAGKNSFEALLINQCFPIPCDQRYRENELSRIFHLF